MADLMVTFSKEKFLEWFCIDRESMIENEFQRKMFLESLKKKPGIIVRMIREDFLEKVNLYANQTKDNGFEPTDIDDLRDDAFEALEKYFLPENR